MNRMLKLAAYAVALFSLLTAQKAQPQLADSPWPMFMHDAQHTGRSEFAGPKNPFIGWISPSPWNYFPVIGKDGNILVGTAAYRPEDGKLLWRYTPGLRDQEITSAPAIGVDGTIYFTTTTNTSNNSTFLCAINPDGTRKWQYEMIDSWNSSAPNIGQDGTIYVYTSKGDDFGILYAINPDGTLKWKKTGQGYDVAPAVGLDKNIYFASRGTVYSVTPEGKVNWAYHIPISGWSQSINSIAVDSSNTIFVVAEETNGKLYALNPSGTVRWIFDFGWRKGVNGNICLGADGTIYAVVDDWWLNNPNVGLYAINANGRLKWKKSGDYSDYISMGGDGTIYALLRDTLCAVRPDSTISWSLKIGLNTGAPIIDDDRKMFVTSSYPNQLISILDLVPGHTPDLAVLSSEIQFDPVASTPGGDVEINVPVHELTGLHAAVCKASFYLDDLSHLLDTCRVFIPAGGVSYAKGAFNTTGLQVRTYNIIIQINNSFPEESNLANNQAESSYKVLGFLQDRINAAQAGDTVWVEPGGYYENLTLKTGVVVKSTHGPEQTIIDGRKKDSVIKAPHLNPTAVLDGFTITNGKAQTFGGGGVFIDRGGVTIRNNIIRGNEASDGGAIWMIGSFVESDPVIENNLIIDNHASFDGGAIYANNSWALVRNNTIVNNRSSFSDKTGGVHSRGFYSPSPDIINCIIWGNGIDLGETAAATYSNIEDGDAGAGNISIDPKFVNPASGDYRLQTGSPCIDKGDPASLRDPDGTRADMGWKYYDQSATIAQIKGRLTDATNGAPVTMAKICLSGPRTDQVPPNAQGNYVFAVPADTGYTVRIFAPNHTAAQKEHLSAKIGEATVVDFSLTPYPTKITLYPPSDLKGSFASGKVHLTWQRPKDELAFDDGFYEESVGFLNSQGILAAGPFKPSIYPAKIEKIKVAFDGERAGDKIELLVYLDGAGTATKPASSQLVYTLPNIPIEVGGGFQEIDVSAEGLTLNSGSFFVGIKQVNTVPMYLLLDHSAADGHGFFDDNLDGTFADLSSEGIHGALAIRAVVSMPSSGSAMALISKPKGLSPAMMMPDSVRLLAIEKNLPTGLVTKRVTSLKSDRIAAAESEALAMLLTPPQSLSVYRSATSPVELSGANKIATLAASTTFYDDMSLGSSQRYYYMVVAKYPSGENIPSNEVYVDIATGVSNDDRRALPEKYALSQNTPNPFNPETVIQYQLPKQAEVRLEIYNILGELMRTLVDEKQPAGYYTVRWNGKDKHNRPVASGVYLYSLRAGEFVQVRKMVLVR